MSVPPPSSPIPPIPPAAESIATTIAGEIIVNKSKANPGGIKDTLESILIALILAFVFRAYFVEAFVIPTGSMATTLYGAHMRFKCEDCGYDFTSNFQAPQTPGSDEINIPRDAFVTINQRGQDGKVRTGATPYVFALTCPNCGFRVPRTLPNNPDNDATAPPVHYGDRILVMKYVYLIESPQRWDVVVFKSPFDQRDADPSFARRPVNAPEFQQNYIKRLVGLPGEQIMVLDGDVYTRSPNLTPTSDTAFSPSGWFVQHKPDHVQSALWRIVHDNDHQPRSLPRAPSPRFASPWVTPQGMANFSTENAGRIFVSNATAPAALAFSPDSNPRTFAFTDWLAFNSTPPQQNPNVNPDQFNYLEVSPDNVVADLQLRLTWQRLTAPANAKLTLELSKRFDRFRVELTPTTATLIRSQPNQPDATLATAPLPSADTLDLIFENYDYRVALKVNGSEVLATSPQNYAPDVAAIYDDFSKNLRQPRPEVRIVAENHNARISHLSLWRDIFYANRTVNLGHKNPLWSSPDQPITLAHGGTGDGEYFVLGDNSQLSLDARFWDDPVRLPDEHLFAPDGRVPDRFMLGKAFFIYWPAGHRPIKSLPGVVPNFEKMRMIR